jgi:Ca-activated chloride channel family protein
MHLRLNPLVAGAIFTFAGSGTCEETVAANPRVTIEPRAHKPSAAELVGRANIRVQSTMVLIPVTVTDSLNRFVTGLEKDDFKLFEENQPQEIASFSSEDTPISVGVVFDCSGSMGEKLRRSRDAVAQFLKKANPEDEFFLVQFNDGAKLVHGFTTSTEEIQNRLTFSQSKGRTALLDAVYRAIFETKRARNPRRALLIISDGGDNNSRYSESEIKNLVKEADVQIYAIGIYEPLSMRGRTAEESSGPELLTHIAQQTGGRQYSIDDVNELADVATKIGVELRNQYILGYAPHDQRHDGKYRRVIVKLKQPKGLPQLRAYWRLGYFAPTE